MRSRTTAEVATWPLLATTAAEEVVLPTVHGVHRAVSDTTFRWIGPPGRPVQRIVDRITDTVYAGVAGLLHGIGAGVRRTTERRTVDRGSTSGTRLRDRAIGVGLLDGAFQVRAGLRTAPMTLHLVGRTAPLAPQDLAASLPTATSRAVVLVHGLLETEQLWRGSAEVPGLPAIAAGSGAAVLLVRYDTGRPVTENGLALAELLETIAAAWPGGLQQLVLVGYSMGGLVIGDATRRATERRQLWPGTVSDVVHLATPHLGSWLEQSVHFTGWTLRRASAITAPLGELLDRRSEGIKDLRFGGVPAPRPADDADRLLAGWGPAPPWQPTARHHLVSGRLHPRPRHPANLLFGDALVHPGSARGVGVLRRVPGSARARSLAVPAGHLALVRRPEVAGLLRTVLGQPSAPLATS